MPVRDLKPMEWVIHVAPNGGVTIYANRTDARPLASFSDMEEACAWLTSRYAEALNEAVPPRPRVPRGGTAQEQEQRPVIPHGRPAVQSPPERDTYPFPS